MAGERPIPSDMWPAYNGPITSTLFGDAAIVDDDGGAGTTTATTIVKQSLFYCHRKTVVDAIVLTSAAAATVNIDIYKHASAVAAADGTKIATQETAIAADVPLVFTMTETANLVEAGYQISVVMSAAPAAPVTATAWVRQAMLK